MFVEPVGERGRLLFALLHLDEIIGKDNERAVAVAGGTENVSNRRIVKEGDSAYR